MRKKREPAVHEAMSDGEGACDGAFIEKRRMSWAALIKKVYEVDPLRCPDCGGEIPLSGISFIDKCQGEVVETILRHCGVWHDAASWPQPVENQAAKREPGYDNGYLERLYI